MATDAQPTRRVVRFADRRWWVKRADEPFGPGPNRFDDSAAAVHVDADDRLVLQIRHQAVGWWCAEVVGVDATGYGRYEWTIGTELADLDRNVVVGLFTWSDEPEQFHRELDIEVSAWGSTDGAAGQFVVQPAATAGHLRAFPLPRIAPWTCSFDWSPGEVTFRAGEHPPWTFAGGGVPRPGGTHPRINLWLHGGADPADGSPVTVTIGSFRFTPRR